MVNLFFSITGYFLTLIGSTYIIGYLNLLGIGYNFKDYVNFIVRRPECWFFVIGLIILLISILKSGKDGINELYI